MIKFAKRLSILIVLTAVTYLAASLYRSNSVDTDGDSIETEHFTISYRGIYEKEATKISSYLEDNYERVLTELGASDIPRVSAFIHPSRADFNKATGLSNSTAIGTSRGPREFHIIWTNWYNSIFPDSPYKNAVHEFAHCVQLHILISEAMKSWDQEVDGDFDAYFESIYATKYPQWFWEAVSIYVAREVNTISVKYAKGTNPNLKSLDKGVQIYNIGYTLIEYIVDTWGIEVLPELIRSYCDLESVLGGSSGEFEKRWNDYLEENY